MNYKNDYDITIKKLDHGFEVKVGCKKFAIEDLGDLVGDIYDYYDKPEKVYKKYKMEQERIPFSNNIVKGVDSGMPGKDHINFFARCMTTPFFETEENQE